MSEDYKWDADEVAKRETEAAEIQKGIDERARTKPDRDPVDGKFKKAISGNPRGRPPKKARSLTPRQLRRDILRIAEAQVTVKTDKGLVKVSAIEAIMMRATSKALSGHGPSIRLVMSLYADKVAEHSDVHDEKFRSLEELEKILSFNPKEDKAEFSRKNMNHMRKLTRRT